MKKVSTVAVKASRKISPLKLTVGLDLGDRSSWYCVLDEAGRVLLEQRVARLPRLCARCSAGCRGAGSHWRRERTRRG